MLCNLELAQVETMLSRDNADCIADYKSRLLDWVWPLQAGPPPATVLLNLGLLPATPEIVLRVHFRFSQGQRETGLVEKRFALM